MKPSVFTVSISKTTIAETSLFFPFLAALNIALVGVFSEKPGVNTRYREGFSS